MMQIKPKRRVFNDSKQSVKILLSTNLEIFSRANLKISYSHLDHKVYGLQKSNLHLLRFEL
jgi:hypothetical protein